MFICCFALWIVLNGRWTTEIALFGLAFAAAAYAFVWKYMGYSPKVDAALVRRLPSAIRYGAVLVREIVKANLTVAGMILKQDFEPRPQLVQFDVPLLKNRCTHSADLRRCRRIRTIWKISSMALYSRTVIFTNGLRRWHIH